MNRNLVTISAVKNGIIVVLWLALLATGCERTSDPVRVRTLSVKDFYPLALERAQKWKSDAYLADAAVDFTAEGEPTCLEVSYGFESPSDDHYSLLITLQEGSEELEVQSIYHQNSIATRNPIEPEDWSLDSLDVLPIVMENGGDEFLGKYKPASIVAYLHLERRGPDARLVWRASCLNLAVRRSLKVVMDVHTGEIIEVKREPSSPSPKPATSG